MVRAVHTKNMKQQFLEDIAGTFQTYVYEDNQAIVPTSATLTVYNPASEVKLIDAQTMNISSAGLLSYNLTTTHNATADENYKAVISYIYDGNTYFLTLFYDVVKTILTKIIRDDDLIAELPQIRDQGWRTHGVADNGSITTIVDDELKRYEDDYWTGGVAYSVLKTETRIITDFVSASGTVTTKAFSGAISASEKYILTRSFTREIQRAFEKIEEKLRQKGRRPHLILDPNDLREVHIFFSVTEICKGFMREGTDSFWWELWKDYEKKAENSFNSLILKYDSDEDNIIDDAEVGKGIGRTIKVRFI